MNSFRRRFHESQTGATFVILAVFMVALFGFASLSIDVSNVFQKQRAAHVGTDAAALAAVSLLTNSSPAAATVIAEAQNIAIANGVSAAELAAAGGVQLGRWTIDTTTGVGQPKGAFVANATPWNAVRVPAKRTVPLFFGKVVGTGEMSPAVQSIAVIGSAQSAQGLIPYGIILDQVEDKQYGDILDIGWNSPGNWGKLDLCGINMSSNPNFNAGMLDGVPCETGVGDTVNYGTGMGGVQQAFDARLAVNPIVILPIVDQFGAGDSGQATILGFVVVELLSQGNNGHNWTGEVRFLERLIPGTIGGGIPNEPFARARALVQ